MWLDIWPLLYYKFTAESVFEIMFEIPQHLVKLRGKSSLPQPSCAPGHSPAERWRTRFRSDIWQTRTVVTTSYYDWYSSITTTSWSTNIRLVKCQPLVTRRLMPTLPPVTVNCVCRCYVLTFFFFLDGCMYSWSFCVAAVNVFLSVNRMMFTSLGNIFQK